MTPFPVNRLMFDLMVHDDRHVLSDLPTPGFHGPLGLGLPPSLCGMLLLPSGWHLALPPRVGLLLFPLGLKNCFLVCFIVCWFRGWFGWYVFLRFCINSFDL